MTIGTNDTTAPMAQALLAWRSLLGDAAVRDDATTLTHYAASTAASGTRPAAVVWPHSLEQVIGVVRIAALHEVPIYPISTGKNWGYGDACAVGAGQVIVELSKMNRIMSVDPELAYAVIEPGVTQQQLSQHLRDNDYPLWMDCTGAGPDTSLLGNILERGFGHSPYGNRLQHVAGMQIVLASGEVLETGFGHYPQAKAHYLFPYGIGPFLDGIFTQSNFGIVTRVGFWLMPKAACLNHFICKIGRHDTIAPVVDALRRLRLDGSLRSIVHIGNDLRLLSGSMVFPRARAGALAALPDALRAQLRRESGLGAWTVSGALYGSVRQVAAARHALRAALRGLDVDTVILSDVKLKAGALMARMLGDSALGRSLRAKVALGEALFALNRGIPNGRFLAGAYWRRRTGLPADFPIHANPAADRCGLLWVSPVLPLRGADLLQLHALTEPIFRSHGFDMFVTFSMINERALGGVMTLAFDKDDPDEVARALSCYRALFACVMTHGYIPYRVGIGSMGDLDPEHDTYWRTVALLKAALDPLGIIAPGRYQPGTPIAASRQETG